MFSEIFFFKGSYSEWRQRSKDTEKIPGKWNLKKNKKKSRKIWQSWGQYGNTRREQDMVYVGIGNYEFWRDSSELSPRSSQIQIWKFTDSHYIQKFRNSASAIRNKGFLWDLATGKAEAKENILYPPSYMMVHESTIQQNITEMLCKSCARALQTKNKHL